MVKKNKRKTVLGKRMRKKVLPFKKYVREIERSKDKEFRKELYKLRERQKVSISKYKARMAAGEVERKKFKIKRGESRRVLTSRAKRIGELSKAFGALPGKASGSGAGRPKGSYKYKIGNRPVSVFEWRKFQAQRKRQLAQFEAQQNQRLARKGYQPEQLQQLRRQRVVEQVQRGKPVMESNIADEELAFRDHLARNTVSPRTQQIMVALRRTQNKAKMDNIEHERRIHERNLVGRSMNMAMAHTNMNPVTIDFTGVSADNILSSPSLFKEDRENFILRKRGRNILDTQENTLRF